MAQDDVSCRMQDFREREVRKEQSVLATLDFGHKRISLGVTFPNPD